ncbi:MAG: PTS fructose transporter subunit IIABC [Mycoplasmatales bacterium]
MFKIDNIFLDENATDKLALIKLIATRAHELGITDKIEQLQADLLAREEEASTGFVKGIAIPHAQSAAIIKPTIIVVKLANAIEYQAMDGEKSSLFISILVGKESSDEHLKILQKLSRQMVSSEYCEQLVKATNRSELFELIDRIFQEDISKQRQELKAGKNIVAVCACPMGLAHTFMAAEVIENYAKKNGHNYKIETQGADGVQNYLSDIDISGADVIIHAIAVTPQDNERFEGYVVNEVGLQELIKNPDELLDGFMFKQNKQVVHIETEKKEEINMENQTKKSSLWMEISKHLMSGISYMIPILVMGGLLGAISLLVPYMLLGLSPDMSIEAALQSGNFNGFEETLLRFCFVVQGFGFTLFGFAIPVFAGFCANSIGGKAAWPIGFIGGYIAINPVAHAVLQNGEIIGEKPIAAGFMGAVIIAFFAGYLVKFLNQKIKLSHNLLAFKTTFLIPLIAAITTMIIMVYVITPVGGTLNQIIEKLLIAAGDAGSLAYTVLLAITTAFDLGGPVNKAAGFVALGFTTDQLLPITARAIAIVVPSIGLGLATIIDKYIVGRKVYDAQYKQIGQTSIFLAFMGISEGAIPFALERPSFVIPINMIGAAIGAVVAVSFGAVQWFPESAIWAWPLIEGIVPYIMGILVGSLFIAIANVIYRNKLVSKGKLDIKL